MGKKSRTAVSGGLAAERRGAAAQQGGRNWGWRRVLVKNKLGYGRIYSDMVGFGRMTGEPRPFEPGWGTGNPFRRVQVGLGGYRLVLLGLAGAVVWHLPSPLLVGGKAQESRKVRE